jgi:hypothetical protein
MSKRPEGWVERMLVAYVDDQLDPAQRATAEEIIRDNPEARAMVDTLRRSAAAVRSAFDQPLREPAPARLLAAIGAAPDRAGTGSVVAFPPSRRQRLSVRPFTALAASLALLLVGLGAGYLQFAPEGAIRPAGANSDPFETSLFRALEQDEPGSRIGYDDAAVGRTGGVTLLGKLETHLGDGCREFQHDWKDARGDGTELGIACRSPAGEWSVLTVPQQPAS